MRFKGFINLPAFQIRINVLCKERAYFAVFEWTMAKRNECFGRLLEVVNNIVDFVERMGCLGCITILSLQMIVVHDLIINSNSVQ